MSLKFYQIDYSFVCSKAKCLHQFEIPLRALAEMSQVSCPKCGSRRDISKSKESGDIRQILRQLAKMAPRKTR